MKLTVEVPYGDVDAMGHLNNVAYLRYMEWARQKYWLALRDSRDFLDIDFVVARAEIDYRASAYMGDVLEVEIRVSRMGTSSFDFSYRITGGGGRLLAEAKTTQVCWDWRTGKKTTLSPERRGEIERFEERQA
ncbi:MAG: thioesterase family protein [Thermoanaerobaculia bacterium]